MACKKCIFGKCKCDKMLQAQIDAMTAYNKANPIKKTYTNETSIKDTKPPNLKGGLSGSL